MRGFRGIPCIGRTITSSILRRIRMGTVGSGAAEFPSNSRSYRWGRRRDGRFAEGSRGKPKGYQVIASNIQAFLREIAS